MTTDRPSVRVPRTMLRARGRSAGRWLVGKVIHAPLFPSLGLTGFDEVFATAGGPLQRLGGHRLHHRPRRLVGPSLYRGREH